MKNELETNVGLVIEVLKDPNTKNYPYKDENDCEGVYIINLIRGIRFKNNSGNPLTISEAKEAIKETERRRLIRKGGGHTIVTKYILI